MVDPKDKSEDEWRSSLSPEQFRVTREKGTEPAFSGEYYKNKAAGTYRCVCCNAELFRSDNKYDSGSGWPSFYQPATDAAVSFADDSSHGMQRVEVMCKSCSAHLGHVFDDGPAPTNKRFCINSVALKFEGKKP